MADGTAEDVYYIEYPAGGKLQAARLYKCGAEHFGNGHSRRNAPVAKLTCLTVDTTGPVSIFDDRSLVATVDANACILIAHSCRRITTPGPCGTNPSQGDFVEFEALLVNPEAGDAQERSDGPSIPFPHTECQWIADMFDPQAPFVSIHIECGNTDYP